MPERQLSDMRGEAGMPERQLPDHAGRLGRRVTHPVHPGTPPGYAHRSHLGVCRRARWCVGLMVHTVTLLGPYVHRPDVQTSLLTTRQTVAGRSLKNVEKEEKRGEVPERTSPMGYSLGFSGFLLYSLFFALSLLLRSFSAFNSLPTPTELQI